MGTVEVMLRFAGALTSGVAIMVGWALCSHTFVFDKPKWLMGPAVAIFFLGAIFFVGSIHSCRQRHDELDEPKEVECPTSA